MIVENERGAGDVRRREAHVVADPNGGNRAARRCRGDGEELRGLRATRSIVRLTASAKATASPPKRCARRRSDASRFF